MGRRLERIKAGIVRMNHVILAFPLWLVLGVSGLIKRDRPSHGWQPFRESDDPEKLY